MKTKLVAPLAKGTLVGIQNCVGAFAIIKRGAPNFYYVMLGGKESLVHRRSFVHPLPPGRYLLNGVAENFVVVP